MEPSEPGEATSSAGKSKSWLRWLIPRFSLRTLLVLVFLCAVALGIWVERSERQRRICKEIERLESSTRMDPLPTYLKWLPKSMATFGDGHYVRNVSELNVSKQNGAEVVGLAAGLPCLTKVRFNGFDALPEAGRRIGALTGLREFDSGYAAITDETLSHWSRLQRLEKLLIFNCNVTDEGCKHIAQLRNLRELHLGSNIITDAGVAEIVKLPHLENLALSHTYVTDKGASQLLVLTKLKSLDLANTSVTSEAVRKFAVLKNLTTLHLSKTNIDDSCIEALVQLPKLENLWLEETRCSGKGLGTLAQNLNLKDFRASPILDVGQQIEIATPLLAKGGLPPSLSHIVGDAATLAFLMGQADDPPSNVSLAGRTVAKEHWARLGEGAKSYVALDFSRTRFDDDDLAHFINATKLDRLSMAGTQITDRGLAAIAKMTNLTDLDLSDTQVTDQGLVLLSGLKKLEKLNLDRTQISDAGLMHLQSLKSLVELHLVETKTTTAGVQTLTSLAKLEALLCSHPEEFFRSGGSPLGIWPLLKRMSPPSRFGPGARGPGMHETSDPPLWDVFESALNFGIPIAGIGNQLTIHHIDLTDDMCRQIAAETPLQMLRFYEVRLDDRQFDLLLPEENIQWLFLSGTQITDASVERLLDCRKLSLLTIVNTGITAEGLTRLLSPGRKFLALDVSPSQLDDKALAALADVKVGLFRLVDANPPVELVKKLLALESLDTVVVGTRAESHSIRPDERDLILGGKLNPAARSLRLYGSWIDDSALASIGECKSLSAFEAVECAITDQTIERLTQCPFVSLIRLTRVPITNDALKKLRSFPYLTHIILSGCPIDDDGIQHLAGLDGIESLSLDGTNVTDESIKIISALKNLQWLWIGGTKITDQGIERLREKLPRCNIQTLPPR